MERISFKSGVWHKQCFNCANCKYTLTNTLDDVFDKNGQLYCRPCMKKHFADEFAKPTTISDTQKKIIAGKDEEKCPNCEGQLISKCPFGVILWTEIPMKNLANFCPRI